MKELYDPVYYPPSIQGFNENYHPQHQQQLHSTYQRHNIQRQQSSSSSKASTVLGRFLKLGKSKSDASGYALNTSTTSSSGRHNGSSTSGGHSSSSTVDPEALEVDEFRLSPSVRVARGPVEKMVHKANSRKDVSRSHSWIYGSVKLPSDLPFGYADTFSFNEGNGDDSEVMTMTMEQVEQHQQRGGGHYLHTHAVQAMQIPRCQLDYYCTCDCGGGAEDFDMVMMSSSGRPMGPGGSVRGGRRGRGSGNGPCQACAREMAMKYALPSSSKHRKSGGESSESFVSSVRKLTWKSLKQVVKKRPSIDTLKKMPQTSPSQQIHPEYLAAPIVPMPFLSPGAVSGGSEHSKNPLANLSSSNNSHYGNPRLNGAVVSHNGAIHSPMMIASPQSSSSSSNNGLTMSPHPNGAPPSPANELSEQSAPNYFFPEKKGFYASCNDIYGDEPPPHVTASVRVRPKRTRQPYEFPSEFGPVANYEEEAQQLYHSEWDLRQVMSYDVWMNTTSHVKPRPESGNPSPPKSTPNGKNSQQTRSSGNLHVPPPDYPPPEPLPNSTSTTFRPHSRSSSSAAAERIISSSSISTNPGGSVKVSGTSSRSSRASLASLQSSHSSKSSSSSSKSTAKNSQSSASSVSSSDTLTISSFANNPPKQTKTNNNPIIKRSSILAADVSAYQLLKQQTKKNQGKSVQVQVKQQSKPAAVKPAPIPAKDMLEDAFSESSDDLSDNAITGSASTSTTAKINAAIPTPSAEEAAKRGRVRIAGQGIRMAPNNNNINRNKNLPQKNSSAVSSAAPPPPKMKESGGSTSSSRTSTFTSYQSQQQPTKKSGSSVTLSRQDSSGSEDDVWSDCHTDLPYTEKQMIIMSSPQQNMMDYKNHHNQTQLIQTQHVSSKSRDQNHQQQSKGVSMKVNGENVHNNNNTMIVSANMNTSRNHNQQELQPSRATFVTFEQQPPNKNGNKNSSTTSLNHHDQGKMEFEEYEFDQNGGASRDRPKTKTISKGDNSNVVSLNVPRNPMANPSPTSGSTMQHQTYIKHSKGQQSTSSAAATGKFGALRRRKSRNGPNNPGKLLQETIYEEDVEQIDDFNGSQNQNNGHAVKIMVSTGSSPPVAAAAPPAPPLVKPILKNRERTYETPVINSNTVTNGNAGSSSCSINNSSKSDNFTAESQINNNDIYFDSSISTVSTASKKKVQFDPSKLVVCGGNSEEDCSEEYDDDSDQWSAKSEEEDNNEQEPNQNQQRKTPIQVASGNNGDCRTGLETIDNSAGAKSNGNNAPNQSQEQQALAKARTSFEEEVARKAASFAKSREAAAAKAAQEEETKKSSNSNNHSDDDHVNNLPRQKQTGGCKTTETEQKQLVVIPRISTVNVSRNNNINTNISNGSASKPTKDSQALSSFNKRNSANNRENSQRSNDRNGDYDKDNNKDSPSIQWDSDAEIFKNGTNSRVLNPNSLLFHDTTRIRLNSRPALQENTFNSTSNNGKGGGSGVAGRLTRLKQSNSFRSVSSMPLRPREPPPPPPQANGSNNSKHSLASVVPSRLQKALSTSTLLSKSTERLHNLSNSKTSHYGPGGKLLPSKSQISLPLDYTTTSNQATKAVGIAGSVETLNLTGTSTSKSSTTTSYQKQNSAKTTQPPKSNKYIRASSSSSTRSLANRSKSLTDKCEALEKVLSSSKRNQHYQPGLSLSREDISSPQPLKTAESLPHLPPQDMDSKSIEIVTKENDVSEIRIYSSSSTLPSFPNDENLPYQGIIYESTKTLITTTSPDKSHPEIHYAATDLFPAAGAITAKPQPPALPPAPPTKTAAVPTHPKPGEVETVGKSVVLIIDNSKKSVDTKSQRKESPLTYSQPIDTIPKVRALPQIPPAEKAKPEKQVYSVEKDEEPLYDDVINHVDPSPKTELRAGSLGRKSISSLINSSTKGKEYKCLPPHQLGELPPLPPPPVPPHRSLPTQAGSGQVVSSTLPCPACPPSLPPPNLPSKNLSEFHNRPLVIQENEEDYLEESSVINGFPEATLFRSPAAAAPEEDLEQEVDNLYNDIGTPTATSLLSSPGLVIGQHSSGAGSTMKSSTAAAFASAMKEAFLGAIKSMDFDKRSVHSSSSSSAGSSSHKNQQQNLNTPEASELIYDDTALINHSKMQNSPLPQPPPSNKSSTSSSSSSCPTLSKNLVMKQQQNQNVVDEIQDDEEEEANEPLYDDVLNLTQLEKSKELISQNQNQPNGEYHSSNSSDSGTEDLPPPLPTQGPPPLSKVATDFHFPVLPSIPLQSTTISGGSSASLEVSKSKASESSAKNDDEDSSSDKEVLDRTRSLLNELNEKLSKLNFTPEPSSSSSASSTSPGASSFSSTSSSGVDTKGELSHLAPGDFSTYISKVVISPSSESSGVEEDYNSEKNYSLSNGSDAASSSDENYKMSQVSKLVSETISLARGKFLENMKLSMLSGGSANNSNNNNQDSQGQSTPTGPGLLMMSSEKGRSDDSRVNNNNRNNNNIEEEEEEPIYEEIGDKPEKASRQSAPIPDIVEEDEEEDRSGSPVYADAFDAKSMFDGASRSEILSFLESIRDRLTGAESTSSSESQSSSISSKKDGKFLDLVERNDSGIGSESGSLLVSTKTGIELTKLILPASSSSSGSERSSSPPEMQIKAVSSLSPCPSRKQLCSDCNDVDLGLEEDPTVNTGVAHPPPHLVHHHHHLSSSVEDVAGVSSSGPHSHSGRGVCRSCNRKRNEKKEIIMEIYETELKYGRDLRIISEEFYKPIQIAGLLAKEQLDQIFLNVDELSQISLELTSRLKMAIHKSTNANGTVANSNETNKQGDEDLSDVNVGKIFLQLGESMMTAFENYCTRQANAGALLSQLEKEKELLRIFLRVSQMENTVLRRMNLPAFLMVPVQRVTRYPLLLSRLVKVTPADHFSRDELQSAQEKIEQHLEHMNKTTREVASVKLWRRISIINGNSSSNNSAPVHRRSNSDLDTSNIRIRKMAMDVMDWSNFNDVSCVIDNQLGSVHFNGKAMRNIYGCLLARGKDLDLLASKMDQDLFFPPAEDVVKDVKLVLVRVKNTRFCLLREPLCLSKCVVSQGENEFQDFIEINEITTKNTYFIQGLDKQSTGTWLKFLQCYSSCVGHWRRRRPALANIMMNGMIKHL